MEFWGDSMVVINWVNGAWELKGHEHAEAVREVVDQVCDVVHGWRVSGENRRG